MEVGKLQLNLLKTEKIYKFEEFITFIRRGYSMAELLNSGAKYSKEGISYITNSNISKGFLDTIIEYSLFLEVK